MKESKDSKFWIHPDDFDKIISYASSAYNQFKSEIGGQLIVVEDKDGDYILKDPVILKQEISGGNCTLDAAELALHYSKMMKEHGKNVRHCWWHSHHTMKAFWSGTDNATILETPAKDWTVSLVVNLKREYKLRIQFFSPFLHEENVELNFLTIDSESNDDIDKEVKELCTKEHVTVKPKTKPYNYKSGWSQTNLPLSTADSYDDEMDYYNYNASYNVYNTRINKAIDFSKMPRNTQLEYTEKVEALTDLVSDKVHATTDNLCSSKMWNRNAKKLNKELSKYNLKVATFKTDKELDDAILTNWPDDFFENIHKPERMVN